MTAQHPALDTEQAVRAWTEHALGGDIDVWSPIAGGYSRVTWLADVAGREAVVRWDRGTGPLSGSEFDLQREAVVYRALEGVDDRIPTLLGSADGVVALSRIPGAPAWNETVLNDVVDTLVTLHSVDATSLTLPGFARDAYSDVLAWRRIHERFNDDEWLTLAFDLLEEHFPGEPDRLVLCHGDVGAGNVLVDDGRLTGLVDWEFSHLGDPIDDLAWITVRSVITGTPLTGFRQAAERYARAMGVAMDEHRLRYWQAVVLTRSLVCCEAALALGPSPVHQVLKYTLHALLSRSLMEMTGRQTTPDGTGGGEAHAPFGEPSSWPGSEAWDDADQVLRQISREAERPEHARALKEARWVLRQLRASAPYAIDLGRSSKSRSQQSDRLSALSARATEEVEIFASAKEKAEMRIFGFND